MSQNEISAKQLIYTRVEADYSPMQKSGYQVFYASRGLDQVSIDFIVKKVSDFQPHASDVVRWQCFFLSNNDVALTRTCVIDSHPEIIDRDRRPDILLAHCLVLTSNDYYSIQYNPFLIFENFEFVSSAVNLVSLYSKNEQKETRAAFAADSSGLSNYTETLDEKILPLLYISSPKFVADKKTFFIYGTQSEVYYVIKSAYKYAPLSYRKGLSFDTYIQGRQVPLGEYWAVGLHERKHGYSISFNAATKEFSSDPEKYADIYTTWLQGYVKNDMSTQDILAVQNIVNLFFQKQVISKDLVSHDLLSAFYDVNRSFFADKVFNVVKEKINEEIASLLTKFITEGTNLPVYYVVSITAVGGISTDDLNEIMRRWLVSSATSLSKLEGKYWDIIREFSVKSHDLVLQLWSSLFTKNKKIFTASSNSIGIEDYDYVLRLLNNPLPAVSMFLPRYAPHFVKALSSLDYLEEDEFVDTVEVLLEAGVYQDMDYLVKFVPPISNKYLTKLEKVVAKHGASRNFLLALKAHRSKLGEPYTFADSLFGRK